ncbi:MAG: TetR/AcrR family transcriptional regulator [Clostridia bacterium]|nr:TetR/AcrR family transcriptional regulator [Clostridia bacterium]
MENQKPQDRRVLKTRRAVHNAFAQLLAQKDINDITVKEIADAADINRKTFYRYYAGIYELMGEIENEVTTQLAQGMQGMDLNACLEKPYLIFDQLNAIISSDLDFYGSLLRMETNSALSEKMTRLLQQRTTQALRTQFPAAGDGLELAAEFLVSGMLAVYKEWFRSDRSRSLESVSKTVGVLCLQGLNGLLHTAE